MADHHTTSNRAVDRRTVQVSFYWRKLTRREREVMERVLAGHAERLVQAWDNADRHSLGYEQGHEAP